MTNTALIVIDVQKGFDSPSWGQRNNPNAESRIAELISAWRARGMPIVHVQHCSTEPNSPLRPDQPGNEFKDIAQPEQGEKHITKTVNSAFIGTDLEQYLHDIKVSNIVIIGLTTDHCISTTTRMAGNLGFDVSPGNFAENLTTEGIDLVSLPVGTRTFVGEEVILEVTQIGKECHTGCAIYRQIGKCVMPKEGVFARVIRGGLIKAGDQIRTEEDG